MNRQEIHKLLGGYATGTLTPEEQQTLFEAALTDQELFDALVREQSLRDLLRDPAAKAQVLAALDERPEPWYRRRGWWTPVGLAAIAAMVLVAVVSTQRHAPKATTVAQLSLPPAPAAPGVALERQETQPANKPAPAAMKPPAPAQPEQDARRTEAKPKDMPRAAVAESAPLQNAAAPPPPPPAPAPVANPANQLAVSGAVARALKDADTKEKVAVTAAAPVLPMAQSFRAAAGGGGGGAKKAEALDALSTPGARAQFYGNTAPAGTPQTETSQQASQAPATQAPAAQQAQAGQQGARAVGAMAKSVAAPVAVPVPGVRYRLVRTGETVQVEFIANTSGQLSVTSAGREILAASVSPLAAYTTPPLTADDRSLSVVLTRPNFGLAGNAGEIGNLTNHEYSDGAMYVVGQPGSPVVRFTIPVNVQ